jgi:hypothetical protein
MHYELRCETPRFCLQAFHPPHQDPARRATPAGVQESYAASRRHQIYGDAVGNRHREQDSRCHGDPAIDGFDVDPPAARIDPEQLDTVNLVAQCDSVEAGERATKREPAAHDLTDRLPAPESQVEAAAGLDAAASDAGYYAVTFSPAGNLKTGDGSRNRNFS